MSIFAPKPLQAYSPIMVDPSTLAPGMSAFVNIDPLWKTWAVKYKGVDDHERATKMNRDSISGQEHIIRRGGKGVILDALWRPNGELNPGDWPTE